MGGLPDGCECPGLYMGSGRITRDLSAQVVFSVHLCYQPITLAAVGCCGRLHIAIVPGLALERTGRVMVYC